MMQGRSQGARIEGWSVGRGSWDVPSPPTGGWVWGGDCAVCPSREFKNNYQNGSSKLPIPYLPVLPESEVPVKLKFIGDRSSILETIITPSGKLRVRAKK